jgi:MFS family permease
VNANRTIAAAIGLIALVGVSLSLTIPLLAIAMERMGVSSTLSGLNTAVAGLANMAVVPFVPRLAARIGVQRLVMAALLLGAVASLSFPFAPFWAWFPLRFALGASLGTLFVLSEFWINAAAPPEKRGFVMGIYATVLSAGFASGPALLALTGTEGWPPFLMAGGLFLLAFLPLLAAGGGTPALEEEGKSSVFAMMFAIPTATFAALTFGAVETGAFALLPVYGLREGYGEATAALLISVATAGNILCQMPLGALSDRIDRRRVLAFCGLAGVLGCLLMPVTISNPWLFLPLLCIWGGLVGGLYTVGLAHLGARFTGLELASANAAFVMLYSAGLTAGPPIVGAGMDAIGPHGFALALAAMLAGYTTLVLWRLLSDRKGE